MTAFNDYNLQITPAQEKIIQEYLDEVLSYITRYNLDKDLYTDIEERLFEKLQSQDAVTNLNLQKAIHEIGKAEEIFSDGDEKIMQDSPQRDNWESEYFYNSLIKKWYVRTNKNAFVLWLSALFWEKIWVSTWAMRIVFLILLFVGGISLWIYFIAGLIIPLVWIDYKNKSILRYLITQLKLVLRDTINNTIKSCVKAVYYLVHNIFNILWTLVRNVFPILRFMFFGLIACWTLFILCWLILLTGAYITGFTLQNIEFLSATGPYFIWATLFGIIFSVLLLVFSCFVALWKKGFTKYFLLFGVSSFLAAFFLSGMSAFTLANSYSQKTTFTQVTSVEINDTNPIIDFSLSSRDENNLNNNFTPDLREIELRQWTGATLSVEVENTIYGDSYISSRIKDALSEYNIEKNNTNYTLTYSSDQLYSAPVPFTIHNRKLIITIPKNAKIHIPLWYLWVNNGMWLSETQTQFSYLMTWNQDSFLDKYLFFNDTNDLVYEVKESDIINLQQDHIIDTLKTDLSDLSPLKHSQDYIENNSFYEYLSIEDIEIEADWYIKEYNFEDDNLLSFIYGDYHVAMDAQVEYKLEGENVSFLNFEIINMREINQNYYEEIDENNYINLREEL